MMTYGHKEKHIIDVYLSIENEIKSHNVRKIPKWQLITSAILMILGAILPIGGLNPYIVPVLLVWAIAHYFGILGKPKAVKDALIKKKALPQAIKEVLLQRGIESEVTDKVIRDFPKGFWAGQEYDSELRFDQEIQTAFERICRENGASVVTYANGGIEKEFL